MVLQGHYNPWLVGVSYLIACAGSYLALRLARRHGQADDPGTFNSITPPAIALGLAIWAMHFTGMAAFSIPGMTITYRSDFTLLSLAVAILFTWFGFATLALSQELRETYILAGLPMACGILAMHFLGMAAMTGDMEMRYDAGLVIAAAAIAGIASIVSLWLASRPYRLVRSTGAAMVMAAAICGMHYVGIEAAVFTTAPHYDMP